MLLFDSGEVEASAHNVQQDNSTTAYHGKPKRGGRLLPQTTAKLPPGLFARLMPPFHAFLCDVGASDSHHTTRVRQRLLLALISHVVCVSVSILQHLTLQGAR